MITTSKSITPIARRKKSNDGSGMPPLRILLAFAIASELWSNGLVPIQPLWNQKFEKLRCCGGLKFLERHLQTEKSALLVMIATPKGPVTDDIQAKLQGAGFRIANFSESRVYT
jgi:hypothetical protein